MRLLGGLRVQRAAARLAGRELRRRPWRTALVALLVALPVAAMVLSASLLRTARPPFDLEDRSSFGLADAIIRVGGHRPGMAPSGPAGPPGSRGDVAEEREVRQRIMLAAPAARVALVEEAAGSLQGPVGRPRFIRLIGPEDDPIVAPRTTLRTGRLPRAVGEVAVSPAVARAWQVQVGSRLDIPQIGLRAEVVGVAHPLAEARSETIHVGAMPDIAEDQRSRQLFVDLPGGPGAVHAAIRSLADRGPLNVPKRNQLEAYPGSAPGFDSDRTSEVRWTRVIGGIALAVFGIVIAAAFAVGARRQLRTLGILASNGASPAALRAVVLWQGAWAGVLGAAAGLGLGGLGLVAVWPHHDRFLAYEPRWFTVRFADLVPIAVLGASTALLASAQPARTVSRLSILSSLAGRRPLAAVPRRVVLLGITAMAAGTGFLAVATVGGQGSQGPQGRDLWAGIGVLGGLGLLFGSAAVAPAVVSLFDPMARRLRGSPLLALRSLGRQRARTGAVVAAVAAAASLAVAASATLASTDPDGPGYLPGNLVLIESPSLSEPPEEPLPTLVPGRAYPMPEPRPRLGRVPDAEIGPVASLLPGARRVDLQLPLGFLVATPEVLDAFEVNPQTRRLLDDHGAVRPGGADRSAPPVAPYAPYGAVAGPGGDEGTAQLLSLAEGAVPAPRSPYGFLNQTTLLNPSRAAPHLSGAADSVVALLAPQPLTRAQQSALSDLSANRQDAGLRLATAPVPTPRSFLSIQYDWPPAVAPLMVYVVLDGLALLFTGFVILVGMALAAAETREEVEVLTAVGAAPSTLRRLAATKAGLLAGAGVALALPTGLIPVWVVRNASNGSSHFAVPWASLGLLVVVLPAAVALLALAGSTVRGRLRPVTASTMITD